MHCVMGDAVDAPRHAVAGEGDGLDGAGLEDGRVGSGEAEAVVEIGTDLLAGEAAEMASDDDALGEGFMHGHGQPVAQHGEADEQQAEPILGIHPEVAQQPEFLEDLIAEVVRFVEDEEREQFRLRDHAGGFRADGVVGCGAGGEGPAGRTRRRWRYRCRAHCRLRG